MQIKKILVQINSSVPSAAVMECATELAAIHEAKVTFVDVAGENPWPLSWMTSGIEHAVESISHGKAEALEKVILELGSPGYEIEGKVLSGRTSVALTHEVIAGSYDLLITHSKGASSRREEFFGTTARRLMRNAPCPVLLVKTDSHWRSRRIVAAVDAGSVDDSHADLNRTILQWAHFLLPSDQAHPEVVGAWSMYVESALKHRLHADEFEALEERMRQNSQKHLDELVDEFGMGKSSHHVHLYHGEPTPVVVNFVSTTPEPLLVMGTVGRKWLSGLLFGNTAEQVINKVQCSVLAVKPSGFVSPYEPAGS